MINWISEKDRLPEMIEGDCGETIYPWVLIRVPYETESSYEIGYYSPARGWCSQRDGDLFAVTYWAELQEPGV